MRDEIDGRLWAAHHKEFSGFADRAIGATAAKFREATRLAARVPNQLLGLGLAIAMSTLTFSTAIA